MTAAGGPSGTPIAPTIMSTETSDSPDDSSTVTQRHEKNLIITAYADGESEYEDKRDFVTDVFDFEYTDLDPEAETTTVKTYPSIEVNLEGEVDGMSHNVTETIDFTFTYDQDLVEQMIEDGDLDASEIDWLTVDMVENENTEFDYSTSELLKHPFSEALKRVDLSEFDYEEPEWPYGAASWSRDIDVNDVHADPDETEKQQIRVNARANDVQPRQVLKPQDERTGCDRFETDDEYWSLQIIVDIEAQSQDELSQLESRLAPTVIDAVGQGHGIVETRITDCEVTTTSTGACHDI